AYVDVNIAGLADLCNEAHAVAAAYRGIFCDFAVGVNLVEAEIIRDVLFVKKYIVEESFDRCIRLFRVISGSDQGTVCKKVAHSLKSNISTAAGGEIKSLL